MSDIKKGRPSTHPFTTEKGEQICDLISSGLTLTAISAMPEFPSLAEIYRWMDDNPDFRDSYTHARRNQADTLADMVLSEAFNSHDAQIGRLRIDALKWTASKLAPKKYGDKVEIETHSQNNFKVTFDVPERETLSAPIIDVIPQLAGSDDAND